MMDKIPGNSHQVISWFLHRNSASQKGMEWYIKSDEREKLQPRILYQQDSPSDLMEKLKAFQTSKSEENLAPSNQLVFLIGG